jgi:hypothetical protein
MPRNNDNKTAADRETYLKNTSKNFEKLVASKFACMFQVSL